VRAKQLEQQRIKAIDALHVVCAEASQSDYFITCDKRLINCCQGLTLKAINPTDFLLEMEDDN
jgi:predicted nucleic acid-binding protein